MKDATPFRPNAQAGWGFNSPEMDVIAAHSELSHGHELRDDEKLLLDLTAVNLCLKTNPDKETIRLGSAITVAKHGHSSGTQNSTSLISGTNFPFTNRKMIDPK